MQTTATVQSSAVLRGHHADRGAALSGHSGFLPQSSYLLQGVTSSCLQPSCLQVCFLGRFSREAAQQGHLQAR